MDSHRKRIDDATAREPGRRLLPDGSVGDVLAAGQVGARVIRGPRVSPGCKGPARDNGAFTKREPAGGNLADADGRLFACGRSDDPVIRNGHKVDPAMIEQAMTDHPAVGQPGAYAPASTPTCSRPA